MPPAIGRSIGSPPESRGCGRTHWRAPRYHRPMRDVDVASDAICAAGRRLGSRGLIAGAEGNLSVRLADGRVLTTPTGLRKDELRPDDLVQADLDGQVLAATAGRRPSSDLAIHLALYRARPDVRAVAHAHLPAAMALTLADETPDPAALPETALLLGRLPVVAQGAMGSDELARRIAAALAGDADGRADAALIERHGAIAVGMGDAPDVALVGAVNRLELVDVLCRVWLDATVLRTALGRRGPIEPAGG